MKAKPEDVNSNRLDLESLGSWPTNMPKNFPGTGRNVQMVPWSVAQTVQNSNHHKYKIWTTCTWLAKFGIQVTHLHARQVHPVYMHRQFVRVCMMVAAFMVTWRINWL